MFRGIVEGVGRVEKIHLLKKGARISIRSQLQLYRLAIGASIAVNGCCLTVVRKSSHRFEADLSAETLAKTNLGVLHHGELVNLERPMRFNDSVDGHLVQGHVDGIGYLRDLREMRGSSRELKIEFPKSLRRYFIPKGSVAVDGISLTINRLSGRTLSVMIIPHTLKTTNLKAKRVGDPVNLEVDMIGKYVETWVRNYVQKTG